MGLWDRWVSYPLRTDDDPVMVARKFVYVLLYPAVIALCTILLILTGSPLMMFSMGAYLGVSVLYFVHFIVTRTFPNVMFWTHVAYTAIFICALDVNSAASSGERTWPFFILMLDVLLICRTPAFETKIFVGLIAIWLLVTYVEKAYRFGLFDAPGTRSFPSRRSLLDCEHPPCKQSTLAFMGYLVVASTFILDYYFTRGFADQVFKEKKKVETVIHVAEEVAAALAAFDLDTAEETLQGARLPDALQSAFNNIISNLKLYRPFLPDALFHELHTPTRSPFKGQLNIPPGSNTSQATLVFTDIQSSTAIWEVCPDGMKKALRKHNAAIRDQLDLCSGYEVKTIGDAFMVAFEGVEEAVQFAFGVQLALYRCVWPAELLEHPVCAKVADAWNGLRVRIGIHTGDIELELNSITGRFDYFGPTVNKAARIEAAAVGGGIAVSEEVLGVLRAAGMFASSSAPAVIPMGERVLRGVPNTTQLTMLIPAELAARKPHIERQLRLQEGGTSQAFSVMRPVSAGTSQGYTDPAFETTNATVGKAEMYRPCFEPSVDEAAAVNDDLCKVLQYLERSGGTAMVLVGGALTVGWNISKKCATHFESAMRWVSLTHNLMAKDLVVGVSSGQVVSGTFGTMGQRFLASIGACVSVCNFMTSAAGEFGVFAVLGMSHESFFASFQLEVTSFLRPLDRWYMASEPSEPITIYEISPSRIQFSNFASFGAQTMEDEYGWSPGYWMAFSERDTHNLRRHTADDPVVAKVIGRLQHPDKRILYC